MLEIRSPWDLSIIKKIKCHGENEIEKILNSAHKTALEKAINFQKKIELKFLIIFQKK